MVDVLADSVVDSSSRQYLNIICIYKGHLRGLFVFTYEYNFSRGDIFMDYNNNEKKKDASAKLAEAIAGQDINSLKEMILDQMGIDSQDELIDRVLDIIEDDEVTETKDEAQVVELYKQPEEQGNAVPMTRPQPQQPQPQQPQPQPQPQPQRRQEPKKESESSSGFDPIDLLLNNKDLLLNLLKKSLFDVKPEDDARVQLLHALKPFCNDKRQGRIDRAVQMMGISRYFEKYKAKE